MRIAIDISPLVEPFPSGVGTYTKNLLSHLLDLDAENHYTLFYNTVRQPRTDFLHMFRKANVQVKRMWYPNKILHTSFFLFERPALDHLLGRPDLFFMPNLGFIALSSISKLILTVHDLSFIRYSHSYSMKKRLWHSFVKPGRLLKRCAAVIVPSESTKRDLIELFPFTEDKTHVIPLGVDFEAYASRDEQARAAILQNYHLHTPFFLYLGNIDPRKNIESLIEAYRLFRASTHGTAELVLVGNLTSHSQRYATRLQRWTDSIPGVHFLAYVPDADRKYLYQSAHAFIYPSLYEGFGLPPLEAMAAGTPVVASASSSLLEVLGDAALFVDPMNVQEITKALRIISSDEKLRTTCIERGIRRAKFFSWDKTAKETLKLFKEVGK